MLNLRSLGGCLLAAALLVLAATAASASTAAFAAPALAPTQSVTFGVQPANAKGPDGRPFFTFGGTPGSRLTDYVAVLNYSLVPLTLTVYGTDALNTAEGGFTLLEAEKSPVDAGAWIASQTKKRIVVVPARLNANAPAGQVIFPLAMLIPANASPGDHGAGIIASLSTVSKNAQGTNVILDQRVATRVYVRVAGQVRPKLAIENLSAVYHGTLNPFSRGFVTVTYIVHNKGNVKLGGRQAVEVTGLYGGTENAPKMIDIPLLFPGSSIQVIVDVPGVLPEFRMTATAKVIPLMLSGDVDPGLAVQISDSVDFWAIPWPLIVLIGCLLLLIVGWWWRRRRLGLNTNAGSAAAAESKSPEKVSS